MLYRCVVLAGGSAGWLALASTLACSGNQATPAAATLSQDAASSSAQPFEAATGSMRPPSADADEDVSVLPGLDSPLPEASNQVSNPLDALAETSSRGAEASVDADVPSAADVGAGSDSATPACVTAGAELCDDFESGQLDQNIWKINLGGPGPSVTVDGIHAHSGRYAVHAKVTPGQQSTAQITEAVTFPATDDTFYTRIWAYFSPDVAWPANPPDFHTGFIIAGGNNNLGHVELAVGANLSPSSSAGPMHYLGYSIYRGPPYVEFGPRSPTQVATSAWTCIELLEGGQGGTTAVRRIWVDGTELPEQNDSFGVSSPMGQKPPQFNLVSIGIWEYHPTPSLSDMWIDDVRVSSQRIGCAS